MADEAVQGLAGAADIMQKYVGIVAGCQQEVVAGGVPAQAVDGAAVGACYLHTGACRGAQKGCGQQGPEKITASVDSSAM